MRASPSDVQGRRDSNPQPPVLETGALPIEPLPYAAVGAAQRQDTRLGSNPRKGNSAQGVASLVTRPMESNSGRVEGSPVALSIWPASARKPASPGSNQDYRPTRCRRGRGGSYPAYVGHLLAGQRATQRLTLARHFEPN